MNSMQCMKALSLAGRVILENGGETYRAEDTVLRMARALGLNEPDVFAIPSGLFISFMDETGEQRTSISRVYLKGTHLARVNRVNEISRALTAGRLQADELLEELSVAERMGDGKPSWYSPLMAFFTSAAFAVMFGGGLLEVLLGGLCGGLTQVIPRILPSREHSAGMSGTLLSSVFCAFIPLTFRALTGLCATEVVIAASIMPLVPGLSMTNATQDILRGDMVSGVAHCARAIMIAAMVAGGAIVDRSDGSGSHACFHFAHVAAVCHRLYQQLSGWRGLWSAAFCAQKGGHLGRPAGCSGLCGLLAVYADRYGRNRCHVPGGSGGSHRHADGCTPL